MAKTGTWVFRNGRIVLKDRAGPRRETGAAPAVISDSLGLHGMVHPATGKRMDSKSGFRAETKARGLTEMGNERQRDTRPSLYAGIDTPTIKRDIAQAIRELGG